MRKEFISRLIFERFIMPFRWRYRVGEEAAPILVEVDQEEVLHVLGEEGAHVEVIVVNPAGFDGLAERFDAAEVKDVLDKLFEPGVRALWVRGPVVLIRR